MVPRFQYLLTPLGPKTLKEEAVLSCVRSEWVKTMDVEMLRLSWHLHILEKQNWNKTILFLEQDYLTREIFQRW